MLDALFANHAYVRVRRNEFRIRHVESGTDTTVRAETPFSTIRMLIGEFSAAEHTLKTALKKLATGRIIPVAPRVVIHPLDMTEGGLSQVEERVLREVAIGAGASRVVVWVGPELSDSDIKQKLSGK
jgi:hypothetical protein